MAKTYVKYCCDAKASENYNLSQVSHGMPYFAGARVQQGYGLGNLCDCEKVIGTLHLCESEYLH